MTTTAGLFRSLDGVGNSSGVCGFKNDAVIILGNAFVDEGNLVVGSY
jgi:hypothetical protein